MCSGGGRGRFASEMFELLQQYAQNTVEFVRVHETWAAPIAFVLAFAESLAFVSLFVPTWAALIGVGALIGAGDLRLWPIWIGAALGAGFGDSGIVLAGPQSRSRCCRNVAR